MLLCASIKTHPSLAFSFDTIVEGWGGPFACRCRLTHHVMGGETQYVGCYFVKDSASFPISELDGEQNIYLAVQFHT